LEDYEGNQTFIPYKKRETTGGYILETIDGTEIFFPNLVVEEPVQEE
jgi:hypothetical protein